LRFFFFPLLPFNFDFKFSYIFPLVVLFFRSQGKSPSCLFASSPFHVVAQVMASVFGTPRFESRNTATPFPLFPSRCPLVLLKSHEKTVHKWFPFAFAPLSFCPPSSPSFPLQLRPLSTRGFQQLTPPSFECRNQKVMRLAFPQFRFFTLSYIFFARFRPLAIFFLRPTLFTLFFPRFKNRQPPKTILFRVSLIMGLN